MHVRWIVGLSLVALPACAAAQEASPADAPYVDEPVYQVELIIVEGEGSIGELKNRGVGAPAEAAPWTPVAADPPAPYPAERTRAEVKDVPAGAILPAPVARPAPGPAPLRDLIPQGPNVTILAAPKLAVIANRQATVHVATQQVFEYLEPLGGGKFQLKRSDPLELGILINLTVAVQWNLAVDAQNDEAETVTIAPLEIQVTSLDGREPVAGTDLDAGKPIVTSRSLKTTVPARIGEERVLPIPSGPDRQAAVVFRVTRMETGEQVGPRSK